MATILVPLDTSDSSSFVMDQARKLGLDLKARLLLFHVVEPVTSYVPVGASMDVISTPALPLDEEQLDPAMERLEKLATPLRQAGLDVATQVVVGLPVDEILDSAKESAADYILLGSHGHGALFHLFSGSVVTGVLKHSPCPVLVVPARKD